MFKMLLNVLGRTNIKDVMGVLGVIHSIVKIMLLEVRWNPRAVKAFIAEASRTGHTLWFDMDGTLVYEWGNKAIANDKRAMKPFVLTPLGRWIRDNNIPIHIATHKGYPRAYLRYYGLNVVEMVQGLPAMLERGMANIEDYEKKIVHYIVDNESQNARYQYQVDFTL